MPRRWLLSKDLKEGRELAMWIKGSGLSDRGYSQYRGPEDGASLGCSESSAAGVK